jgi:hypothetical protein
MIKIADTPISEVLEKLGDKGLRGTIVVPTLTALEKSIMDATEPVRIYLKAQGIHDYSKQNQGQDSKVVVGAYIHVPGHSEKTTASLYRPDTKNGDPRIWVSGLKKYAMPGNVIAIVAHDRTLHFINLGKNTPDTLDRPSEILKSLFTRQQQSTGFQQLLSALRGLAAEGWIRSLRHGDTGVGFTLETKLGISANSSRTPDYLGVEIKSKRARLKANDRVTLFSKTPDWKLSKLRGGFSAREFVEEVGSYSSDHACKIYYATIYPVANPQGIKGEVVASSLGNLYQTMWGHDDPRTVHCWQIETLQKSLSLKHRETAFVSVDTRKSGQREEFLFTEVSYRSNPAVENLEYLMSAGDITLDYTLSLPSKTRVRDHGYLFRMQSSRLNRLFANEQTFSLMDPQEAQYWRSQK